LRGASREAGWLMADRPPRPSPDRLLDVHEAAALLALAPGTLYQWAYRRRLPTVKPSGPRGPLRFRLSDIEKLIADSVRPALGPRGSRS
jgi:excisionase family DNA binding protein